MKWFKFYSEFKNDTKIKRLPIAHRYAFIILLCLANEGEGDRWGKIRLDDEDIAFELEMEEEDWLTLKAKFKAKGFINFEQGTITICNWAKRQERKPSDQPASVRERVSKHRANKKEAAVTPCNALHVKSNATEKIREDLEEIRKDLDQTQDPEVRDRKIEIAADPENPSRVGELENFDLKEPDPEPTEASWQRSWIGCPIEKQSPDQASNGSAQVTSSAAAPLAVENQKHPTAKTDDYYKSGGATKNKPELPADLEHIWVGLGRLDYLPALVDTCTRYLKSLEKPCSNSNAITYIANRIRDREWTAIELRLQEMAEYAQKRQNSESRVNHPQRPPDGFEGSSGAYRHHSDDNAPKAFVDMNPQEQAEYKAAIAAMRSKTAGLEFSSIGEAIAQAAELGVAS